MASQSPVALAEQLLELVKTLYHDPASHDHSTDARDAYNHKNRISNICDELKRGVLGPSEYTVLLAGEFYSVLQCVILAWADRQVVMRAFEYILDGDTVIWVDVRIESCQESSALRFVSELGVPDIIADETLSLQEISKKAGVDERYLSKCHELLES